jgi:hypothetical protein
MAQWLKKSTAGQVIPFGPFLDKTDGVTLEVAVGIITSLDHAVTGIFLSKNGGAGAVRHAAVTATTYDSHGMFLVTLDATDTNTLGRLRVFHSEPATYLEVWQDFMVVPTNVWDSMFGADKLDVNVAEQANIDFGALQLASLNAATPVATLANDAVSAAALKTDAVTEIVNAILAADIEGGHTLQVILRIFTAVLAGKASGGGTGTVTFWDHAGTGARIVATVDADGNRDVPSTFSGA